VSPDDPELVRVNEFEFPIVQALMVAAAIVTESIPGIQTAFTIANSVLLARAKKVAETATEPEATASDAPPPGAKEEAPAQ
jgi:hypothetical protein